MVVINQSMNELINGSLFKEKEKLLFLNRFYKPRLVKLLTNQGMNRNLKAAIGVWKDLEFDKMFIFRERPAVDQDKVSDQRNHLSIILEQYNLGVIYNCAEMRLYYKLMLDTSLVIHKEGYIRGENSIDWFTVHLSTKWDGK